MEKEFKVKSSNEDNIYNHVASQLKKGNLEPNLNYIENETKKSEDRKKVVKQDNDCSSSSHVMNDASPVSSVVTATF
jgi:hypothetical protein